MAKGDKALLTTAADKTQLKLSVACNVPMSRMFPHEHLHFNAQARVQQMCSQQENQPAEGENTKKKLTLLKFAYVPLKTSTKLEELRQKEAEIIWVLRSTYQKQWRPCCIGVRPEKPTEDNQAWTKLTEKDVNADKWDEIEGTPYYAAWPVQAYIEGFQMSNNIALTYTLNECKQPENWLHANDDKDDTSIYSIIERKVTLKISGGTVKAYENEISSTRKVIRLREWWEKEED